MFFFSGDEIVVNYHRQLPHSLAIALISLLPQIALIGTHWTGIPRRGLSQLQFSKSHIEAKQRGCGRACGKNTALWEAINQSNQKRGETY